MIYIVSCIIVDYCPNKQQLLCENYTLSIAVGLVWRHETLVQWNYQGQTQLHIFGELIVF